MDVDDEDTAHDTAHDEALDEALPASDEGQIQEPVVTATGLTVHGEHGPLFSDIDLTLTHGLHAIHMPGGPASDVLLLTVAGRFSPSGGTISVLGDSDVRAIRRHSAIAAFSDIDDLDGSVTVQTVLCEQSRWLAPWYARVPSDAGRSTLEAVFGDCPPPPGAAPIRQLSDLELFLLRTTLALLSDRPILVVGDLEQVRDEHRRALAVERLGALTDDRTVIVGVSNPLGASAPEHELHDLRNLNGKAR